MVGLSDLLEAQKSFHGKPQVINKTIMIKPYKPPSSSSPLPVKSFLDECFLCNHRLFPGCDIYMYNGDRAFCSVECRNRQIMMDEEENHFTRQPTSSSVHPRHYAAAASETNTKCRTAHAWKRVKDGFSTHR